MQAEPPGLERIQAAIEAERSTRATYGPVQGALRGAVRAALGLVVAVFLIPALVSWDLARLTGLTAAGFALRAIVVLVGAAVIGILDQRTRPRDPATAAQMVAAEWMSLIHPDWWKRVLRQGLLITAGVGIPVGLLLVVRIPESELTSGGRVALFVQFLGLTAAWALPAAFGIRWLALRSYRRMMVRANGLSSVPSA